MEGELHAVKSEADTANTENIIILKAPQSHHISIAIARKDGYPEIQ